MKRFNSVFSILICITLVLSVVGIAPASAANYTKTKGTITVVCGKKKATFTAKKYGNSFSRALNAALESAGKLATDRVKAKVTIQKGSYALDRTIRVYSNTELVATGCKIKYRGNCVTNNFDGNKTAGKKYSGARNITITGGTWDSAVPYKDAPKTEDKNLSNTTMRFAHMKNLVVRNVTFKNNYNSHDLELGGVNGIDIYKCKFINDKDMNKFKLNGGTEAIQVDVCHKIAVIGIPAYDYTACKNVKIRNNSFKNKYRAVGSHHSVPGSPYDKIEVYDNTMTNIGGIAVNAVYWTNSKIYDNTLKNVGAGIDYSSFGDHNVYNEKKLSLTAIEKVLKKSSTYIYNNKITVRQKNNKVDYRYGIRARGADCTTASNNKNVKKGIYNIYNAHIGTNAKGNKAPNTVTGAFNAGVALNYSVGSDAKYNTVDLTNCDYDSAFGIFAYGSDGALFSNNKVYYSGAATKNIRGGATIRACSGTVLTANELKVTDYGVHLLFGSTGTKIYKNTVSSARSNCVYQSGKEDPTPKVKKTLTVYDNEFNCKNADKSTAGVFVTQGRIMDVTAYGNGEDVCYALQGELGLKTTLLYGDYTIEDLAYFVMEKGDDLLRWVDATPSGRYEVCRVVNGKSTLLGTTSDTKLGIKNVDNYDAYTVTAVISNADVTFRGPAYSIKGTTSWNEYEEDLNSDVDNDFYSIKVPTAWDEDSVVVDVNGNNTYFSDRYTFDEYGEGLLLSVEVYDEEDASGLDGQKFAAKDGKVIVVTVPDEPQYDPDDPDSAKSYNKMAKYIDEVIGSITIK